MPTTPPTLTPIPTTPPSTQDPANFDARMDATLGWLPTMVTEQTALAANMAANASEALSSANAAATSETNASAFASAAAGNAAAAATSAGAAVWVSGSYSAGQAARSPSNQRVYIARTTGSKPTDPASDPTNWRIAGGELVLVRVTATAETAAVGGRYALRNAAASVLTAPPSPQEGDRFAVKVANGRIDNTINWNGAKHEGITDTTSSMERPGFSAEFVYIDATYGWGVI